MHLIVPREKSFARNELRPEGQKYDSDLLSALLMRYESPDPSNRWDSPFFNVTEGNWNDVCPQIAQVLLQKRAPPPNQSTQAVSVFVIKTNFS